MPITGGIKFFEPSEALFQRGATIIASTGDSVAKNMLTMNKELRWDSVGSNDTITETINITFPDSPQLINRFILVDHNLKEFTVKYGSGPTDFTNVVGLDGPLGGGIAETTFARDTAYYEFDAVTTDEIEITATTTQVANEEKFINIAIPSAEIGTFEGFPTVRNVRLNRNLRKRKMLSGRNLTQKSFEIFRADARFRHYPVQGDIDILRELHDREDSFLVWLSGGKDGECDFLIDQKAWRLQDVFQVQSTRFLRSDFERGVYINGVRTDLRMEEEVDVRNF